MKRVVVATHNAHKLAEIRSILAPLGWEFVGLDECGIAEEPREDGASFAENARIKARFAHERTGLAALADDSGLAVEALGGAPGVYSARYAGTPTSDSANNAKLLAALEGVAASERGAHFVCALSFIDSDGSEHTAQGEFAGRIGTAPRGTQGFGYDPLFEVEEYAFERTLAELAPAEKNVRSHRARALEQLCAALTGQEGDVPFVRTAKQAPVFNNGDDGAPSRTKGTSPSCPASVPVKPRELVAFDFDGTLIDVSSPVQLISRLNRDRIMPKKAIAKAILWGARYKMGREVNQAKPRRYIFASFKNFPVSDANAIMRNLYVEVLSKHFRPAGLAAVAEHQACGRDVVIVSASFEPIIEALARELGAVGSICTCMEVVDGFYTGETVGDPPEGEHKLTQFLQWANSAYGQGNWVLTHAYGDHFSDVPLMETACNPVAVDPDRRLAAIAKDRGWQLADW